MKLTLVTKTQGEEYSRIYVIVLTTNVHSNIFEVILREITVAPVSKLLSSYLQKLKQPHT